MRVWILALVGCTPVYLLDGTLSEVGTLDVALSEVPPELDIDAARLNTTGVLFDRCGALHVVGVDGPLDALGPSDEPVPLLPGGYCAIHLLLEDGPDLELSSFGDTGVATTALEVGGVSVIQPFEIGADDVLMVISLFGVERGDEEIGPVIAELWLDVDGDGVLGPADVPVPTDNLR